MSRRQWTRNELLVAFNLYCKLPFGQLHSRTPHIIELSRLLDRTPGSVAMKLVNFASLDPTHQGRGVTGLKNTSKSDRAIWEQFNANWTDLAAESERAYRDLIGKSATDPAEPEEEEQDDLPVRGGVETEKHQLTKVRLGQSFFRQTVLTSYSGRCCVCGLPEESLLVAGHIVPWAVRPDLRMNPRNGLCLCALHDRAFDRGLISLGGDLTMKVSPRLEVHLPEEVTERMFLRYRDKSIHLPEKFGPEAAFLEYHQRAIFRLG